MKSVREKYWDVFEDCIILANAMKAMIEFYPDVAFCSKEYWEIFPLMRLTHKGGSAIVMIVLHSYGFTRLDAYSRKQFLLSAKKIADVDTHPDNKWDLDKRHQVLPEIEKMRAYRIMRSGY